MTSRPAMSALRVQLFGKFSVSRDQELHGFEGSKTQDLFGYLMLKRRAPHTRESLAALLWGDSTTAQSKKYLRQTLWLIRSALQPHIKDGAPDIFLVEDEWLQFNPAADLWLDVAAFEESLASVNGIGGDSLTDSQAADLRIAVDCYRGDLLEGCYHDWCLYERERLRSDYLIMLDKLIDWCESRRHYEAGLEYGSRALRQDRARESTHRQLMRLHYLLEDRTSALRQYSRCASALAEELGVEPAGQTVELYEQIRADAFESLAAGEGKRIAARDFNAVGPPAVDRLRRRREVLAEIERRIRQEIQAVDTALNA